LERIPILSESTVDEVLRRYVTANTLFESTCVAMLERADEDSSARRFMDFADTEFFEAGAALEAALQQVVSARVEETLKLAGLMAAPLAVCR
jgi:hypothetical protein